MSSSFTISLPLLFSINLFIGNSHTSEAALTYTAFKCSGTKQFLPGSTYQKNLNELLSSLSSAANSAGNNSSGGGGFSNAAAGSPPDQAYGIFLCRGDIDALTCSNCISTAAQDIGRQCPGKRTSIIWYDVCMLRYSNHPIYSVMQTAPASTHANSSSITDDPSRFIQLLKEASEDVARKAPSSRSGKKVAAAEAELTDSPQLYMLAECTPDLTPSDCRKCLRWAIAHLPQVTPGGRVLTPSCNVRFREDRFLQCHRVGDCGGGGRATTGPASFCSCSGNRT
ncbi:cysteine-rich receptor-like protein kinase 25 [Eucalyptus grandis]|uniref:cysteine-rich receptor-like protein kinase 25 n=1 Tax=Eucalyptus grandis TaxID=71139 RepID=UPI00192EDF73|nr:cysteine-rich receptor-like protein kinase 25 [Eucalyptus grandis]